MKLKTLIASCTLACLVPFSAVYATQTFLAPTPASSMQMNVENSISLQDAYKHAIAEFNGPLLNAYYDMEYGMPRYSFHFLDAGSVRSISIHSETGAVISNTVDSAYDAYITPLSTPNVSITDAIAHVSSQHQGLLVHAGLETEGEHMAYRISVLQGYTLLELQVSATSGNIVTSSKVDMSQVELDEDDTAEALAWQQWLTSNPNIISLNQAITNAKAHLSANATSLVLNAELNIMDDYSYRQEAKPNEHKNNATTEVNIGYFIDIQTEQGTQSVIIDPRSGKVTQTYDDPLQAIKTADSKVTSSETMQTLLAYIDKQQQGHLVSIEPDINDKQLTYTFISLQNDIVRVTTLNANNQQVVETYQGTLDEFEDALEADDWY